MNELKFFEIGNQKQYSVNVYGSPRDFVEFLSASYAYSPETISRSFSHDGAGPEPGLKHDGSWDLRPHSARIEKVTDQTLVGWSEILEGTGERPLQSRMLYSVNRSSGDTLMKLAKSMRLGQYELSFSGGMGESAAREAGVIELVWGPTRNWGEVILQGPHISGANPMFKQPNPSLRNKQDWRRNDIETLSPYEYPVTSYKYVSAPLPSSEEAHSSSDVKYKVAWRAMAANSGERTLMPALYPAVVSNVDLVYSCSAKGNAATLVAVAGILSSVLSDFQIRSSPKNHIRSSEIARLAAPDPGEPLLCRLVLRTLRLNCLTSAYAELWRDVWTPKFVEDRWLLEPGYQGSPELGDVGDEWTPDTPLRRDIDRRNALVEIDVLLAKMLGITADELATIYRTQFGVLHGYDQDVYLFDANGRIVPNSVLTVWRRKGDAISEAERTATHPAGTVYTYELPFAPRDREADFRAAMKALSQAEDHQQAHGKQPVGMASPEPLGSIPGSLPTPW